MPSVVRAILEGDRAARRAGAGALAATVAVKVTEVLNTLGLADDVSVVVVAPALTVCDAVEEDEMLKSLSPL